MYIPRVKYAISWVPILNRYVDNSDNRHSETLSNLTHSNNIIDGSGDSRFEVYQDRPAEEQNELSARQRRVSDSGGLIEQFYKERQLNGSMAEPVDDEDLDDHMVKEYQDRNKYRTESIRPQDLNQFVQKNNKRFTKFEVYQN